MPPTKAPPYRSKVVRRAQIAAKDLGHRLRWEGLKKAEGYCMRFGCHAKVEVEEGKAPSGTALTERCSGHR